MITTYFRSSSLGTLSMCEMQYFLVYNLGMKSKTNKAAVKGTVLHRVMQALADKKKAQQEGKKTVDFEGKRLRLDKCDDLAYLTQLSFDHYTQYEPTVSLSEKDKLDCLKWAETAVTYNNGVLDPRNQNIHSTELFFDFEIDKPWADYRFTLDKKEISGKLALKGTIDLILEEENNTLTLQDYKTGQRKNWATFKEKTYEDLEYDTQLLLYYYALKNIYPDKEFIISIYYINHGGLFSFVYDETHYQRAESMLRQKFDYVRNIEIPRMISQDHDHPTCKYMCGFNQPFGDSGKSICQHFNSLIREKGVLQVVNDHADFNSLGKYTGGGRIDQ